jgi:hypothetical protein
MPKATPAQVAATETALPPDSTDWAPGRPIKGRTYNRVTIYAQDPGCRIKLKGSGDSTVYTQMVCAVPDHTARHLGMQEVDVSKLTENVDFDSYGTFRAKRIKVPWMNGSAFVRTTKGSISMVSIPIPSGATLKNIGAFLRTEVTQNKPPYYITPDGRRRRVLYS